MSGNKFDILRLFDRRRRLYRRLYAGPDGRAVIDDIMAACGFWRGNADFHDRTGRLDPLALAVAQGKREVASHIMKHLGVSDLEMQLRLKGAQPFEEEQS